MNYTELRKQIKAQFGKKVVGWAQGNGSLTHGLHIYAANQDKVTLKEVAEFIKQFGGFAVAYVNMNDCLLSGADASSIYIRYTGAVKNPVEL